MKALNENVKSILAILIIVLVFAYFFAILLIDGKSDPQVIIAMVALTSAVTGYFYGSTTGSSKKDETIAHLSSTSTVGNSENTTVQINPKQDNEKPAN